MSVIFLDHSNWDYDVATPMERPLGGSQSAMCYLAVELRRRGRQIAVVNGIAAPKNVLGVDMIPERQAELRFLNQPHDAFVVLNGPANLSEVLRPILHSATPLVLWTQHATNQPAMFELENPKIREQWDAFVCVSEWHRRTMLERYALPPDRTFVIGNAVSPAFEKLFDNEDDFRSAKSGQCTLVYTSTPFRGLDVLLGSYPVLYKSRPDLLLRIFSSMKVYNVEGAADDFHDLYERGRKMPGVDYVGSLPQRALAAALRSATIHAYPNTFAETSCIAVMEAMAAGLKVVTSRLGALPETTMNFARLVTPHDPNRPIEDFASEFLWNLNQTIEQRVQDPRRFIEEQRVQAKTTLDLYNWRLRARQWEELIGQWRRLRTTGTTAANDPSAAAVAQARRLFASQQFLEAEQACRSILATEPDSSAAHQLLGAIAYQAGDYSAAVFSFGRAIECGPKVAEYHDNLCMALLAQNRPADGEAAARKAISIWPQFAEAWGNLGNALQSQHRLEEAAEAFAKAVDLKPSLASVHNNLGVIREAQGNLPAAAECYRAALAVAPAFAVGHYNLGKVQELLGNPEAALSSYQQAIELDPQMAIAYLNVGSVLFNMGRVGESNDHYVRTVSRFPEFVEAWYNLGNSLTRTKRFDEAIIAYGRAAQLRPGFGEAHSNLGIAMQALGRHAEACEQFQRAVELNPDIAEGWNNLGNALQYQQKYDEANAAYRRAIELNPEFVEARNNLGNLFATQNQTVAAIECYEKALAIKPDYPNARNSLGVALQSCGCLDQALEQFSKACEIRPQFAVAHSNWLLCQQYHPNVSLASLAAAHAKWNDLQAAELKNDWKPHANDRDPERRLKLGFVSADFGSHPVGRFMAGFLAAIDRESFETFAYSVRNESDSWTERIRGAASQWREAAAWNEDQFAENIRTDQIDILFDLGGHTDRNRLLVFARKPAPIQITWMGYVGTTGLEAMDYLVADRFHVPSDLEGNYRETILRMPNDYICYEPPEDAPAIAPLPSAAKGHVVFGSFNNPAKINDTVLGAWGEVLKRTPNSRLLLIYRGWDVPRTRERVIRLLGDQGIDAERIELSDWIPHEELMKRYHDVDIALDPFPYSGGLTTCEALWMGVPVITLPGETFASRHSLSHLSNVGFGKTIASSKEDYVNKAVEWATNPNALAPVRAKLRPRMRASVLCDASLFASDMKALLRTAWRQWTESALETPS